MQKEKRNLIINPELGGGVPMILKSGRRNTASCMCDREKNWPTPEGRSRQGTLFIFCIYSYMGSAPGSLALSLSTSICF